MAAWGVPRATPDLDFAGALGSADPAALSRALNARFQAGEDDVALIQPGRSASFPRWCFSRARCASAACSSGNVRAI